MIHDNIVAEPEASLHVFCVAIGMLQKGPTPDCSVFTVTAPYCFSAQ